MATVVAAVASPRERWVGRRGCGWRRAEDRSSTGEQRTSDRYGTGGGRRSEVAGRPSRRREESDDERLSEAMVARYSLSTDFRPLPSRSLRQGWSSNRSPLSTRRSLSPCSRVLSWSSPTVSNRPCRASSRPRRPRHLCQRRRFRRSREAGCSRCSCPSRPR